MQDGPLNIGILVERRYLDQDQPAGLIDAVKAKRHNVALIDVESCPVDIAENGWLKELDILVARGRSWALLAMLSLAEGLGVPTINRRAAISAVHNKADMAIALAREKLPVPKTYLGSPERLRHDVPRSDYPLILKPLFGDNGRGLRLVQQPGELEQVQGTEPWTLAQCYLANDGHDLKLYGIGDRIWAVVKPSPFPPAEKSKPNSPVRQIPVTAEMMALGRRCATLFGLELFGVDCIAGPHGPVVIEVNEFPNYTGVPRINDILADYVIRQAGLRRAHP
jgi:ribosomal protein S6--L-glutamate ligase